MDAADEDAASLRARLTELETSNQNLQAQVKELQDQKTKAEVAIVCRCATHLNLNSRKKHIRKCYHLLPHFSSLLCPTSAARKLKSTPALENNKVARDTQPANLCQNQKHKM